MKKFWPRAYLGEGGGACAYPSPHWRGLCENVHLKRTPEPPFSDFYKWNENLYLPEKKLLAERPNYYTPLILGIVQEDIKILNTIWCHKHKWMGLYVTAWRNATWLYLKNKEAVLSQRLPRNVPHIWVPWKFSGLPDYAHGYFSQNFSWAFVLIHPMNVRTKYIKVSSFTRSWDNRGYPKIGAVHMATQREAVRVGDGTVWKSVGEFP